jgi:hypothetical protein
MSEPAPDYRPLLLLGRGGMGSVEAAAEALADGTTRVVALKRILRASTGASDAPRVEMFLREARLTTLLDHPNVIRSYAYGESAGELFLAMEYVAGEPLSRVLTAAAERHESLRLPIVAYLLAEACSGLHAAHELRGADGELLGVVHRDVSPQNVMVGYDGTVKLLDFGVAKIDLLDCAARTKTGEVKGKTAYMSPEQAMGDAIDRRSDLYSMGAVLFESLTGKRMWGAGTDLDVLRKLALEDPPRLEATLPDVPPALAALFTRLVARDCTQRIASAQELADALRVFAPSPDRGAADLRDLMAGLFPGEAKRREAAIASALSSTVVADALPTTAGAVVGSGESGPVFVTHHGPITQAPTRPRPGLIVTGVTAMLVAAVVAVALFYRPAGTVSDTSAAGVSVSGSRALVPSSAPIAPSVVPAPLPWAPAIEVAAQPTSTPPVATGLRHSSPVPMHRVVGPRIVHSPPPRPSSVAPVAPAASAQTGPVQRPEPPDVDPTPF